MLAELEKDQEKFIHDYSSCGEETDMENEISKLLKASENLGG